MVEYLLERAIEALLNANLKLGSGDVANARRNVEHAAWLLGMAENEARKDSGGEPIQVRRPRHYRRPKQQGPLIEWQELISFEDLRRRLIEAAAKAHSGVDASVSYKMLDAYSMAALIQQAIPGTPQTAEAHAEIVRAIQQRAQEMRS